MKQFIPDYYPHFRCLADACRHSCCIGWEIDIDPDTRETYRSIAGPFGERLKNAISEDAEGAHFRLSEKERCPLLNENGLCDLITTLGEDYLCQICADHPRFRNFFPDRTEMGLGLCCEAAAALILKQQAPVRIICTQGQAEGPEDAETAAFIAFRSQLFSIAQNRSLPLHERMHRLLQTVSFSLPETDFLPVYQSLEQLDASWGALVSSLSSLSFASLPVCPPSLELPMEQVLCYLLYRHVPAAYEDGDVAGHTAFCVLSACVLITLCRTRKNCTLEQLMDFARMYSSEIEYSQENLDTLLDALWESE